MSVALKILGWVVGVIALLLGLLFCSSIPGNPWAVLSAAGTLTLAAACIPASRKFIPALRSRTATLITLAIGVALYGAGIAGTRLADAKKRGAIHAHYETILVGDANASPVKVTRAVQLVCIDDAFSAIAIEGADKSPQQTVSMHLADNLQRRVAGLPAFPKDEMDQWTDLLVHGLGSICAGNGAGSSAQTTRDYLEKANIQIQ